MLREWAVNRGVIARRYGFRYSGDRRAMKVVLTGGAVAPRILRHVGKRPHPESIASCWGTVSAGKRLNRKLATPAAFAPVLPPSGMRENPLGGKRVMPLQRYKPEQIVTMLRQIEVGIANGKNTPQACKEAAITVQTFYRWRKEYGGLKMDQAKRMKELEKENGKLKRLVAELSLDKQILKDIAEGNF